MPVTFLFSYFYSLTNTNGKGNASTPEISEDDLDDAAENDIIVPAVNYVVVDVLCVFVVA